MYPQMVEVPKYFVEEEKTTTAGIDRHIPVWPLVEQDWAGRGKGCELCARKREAGSRPGRLEAESMGHIQSAYCEGQAEVVTAAHNRCNRFIQREIQCLVERRSS